jgi:AraC-like DNA-binding protein
VIDDLAARIAVHGTPEGRGTAVGRLLLIKSDEELPPADFLYEPMICFIAGGAKMVTIGGRRWNVGRGQMFFSSLEVPANCQIQAPYRAAVLRLDVAVLTGLLLELDGSTAPAPVPSSDPGGQTSVPMTPPLVEAVTRLVGLLDTPEDISALSLRTEGEVLYRLLQSPIGPSLRQFAVADSAQTRIRAAAAWIRSHHAEPLRIEQIAAIAQMSTATLHRQFKAATGMAPISFQKQVRLQEARRRLLAGGVSAAEVAQAVGYASATQFNREYRRAYGLPPAQDAARLRELLALR